VIPSYEKVIFARDLLAVIINSHYKVLYLLAACQKYEMASVQSTIRAKVKCGEFPAPRGAEAFPAYAIASAKELIPEMENAAHQTLNHPMTFRIIGEGLRLFEGWALRDLASFRRRCRDKLVTCLVEVPSNRARHKLLNQLLSRSQDDLELQMFTHPLDIYLRMNQEYITTFQKNVACNFCFAVHAANGPTLCVELKNKLVQVRDKVNYSL
jgi:hypothetical protein